MILIGIIAIARRVKYDSFMSCKEIFEKGIEWSTSHESALTQQVSKTRDIFQARLDQLRQYLLKLNPHQLNEIALVTAIVGEIGNNSFDHNLGQWQDVGGCWFEWNFKDNLLCIVLSDRGQGILASLRRVMPTIQNDTEALHLAFEKRISGRSPEKRGNGLKLVRSIINGYQNRCLVCFSGSSHIHLGKQNILDAYDEMTISVKGTLTLLSWSFIT